MINEEVEIIQNHPHGRLRSFIRDARSRMQSSHHRPGFIAPMLCKDVTRLPLGEGWFYEVKHDGYRVIAVKNGLDVELFSPGGTPLDYAEAREALLQLRARRAVIDCGLIALDHDGRPSWTALTCAARRSTIRLYAFDLLHLNGRDLTAEPIERRKERLCTLTLNSSLLFSPSLYCEPEMLVEEVRRLCAGGVIAKRKGSTYQPGKCTGSWVKFAPTTSLRGTRQAVLTQNHRPPRRF